MNKHLLPTPENFARIESKIAEVVAQAPEPLMLQCLSAFMLGHMAGCYILGSHDALHPSLN